jgi:hypothetical protein
MRYQHFVVVARQLPQNVSQQFDTQLFWYTTPPLQ